MQQIRSHSKKTPLKLFDKEKLKLPSISKTPLPASIPKISPKSNLKALQTEKNDFELELKNKHHILKSMVDVEKQEHSMRDVSSLNYSFKRMSAGMKVLGNYKNDKALIQKVYENLNTGDDYSFRINDSDSIAKKKYHVNLHNSWAIKRNKNQIRQESSFAEFLDSFFSCILQSSSDLLRLHDIILPLLTYGVASESTYIERVIPKKALRVIFHTEDLYNTQILKKSFIDHLIEDKISAQILKTLKNSALDFIGKSDEPFPKLYYSIENFMKLIKFWWDDLTKSRKIVHISKIAHFLSSKSLIQGFSKSMKFCCNFCEDEFFDLSSFERIFLKPVLLAQIKNIEFGILLEKSDLPMSLKLAIYQRKLLINAVKAKKGDKSRAALQGAYKFNRKSMSYSDASVNNLQLKVKEEENLNKLKIKQIIYEAEHEGSEFVNKDGEIRDDIVNTWDVKDNINSKEASPKGSSGYIEVLKAVEAANRDESPYGRNVKIFRDNFLFEKFQKVTSSTYNLELPNN